MMGSVPNYPDDQAHNLADLLRENREQSWAYFLKNADWQIYLGVRGQND